LKLKLKLKLKSGVWLDGVVVEVEVLVLVSSICGCRRGAGKSSPPGVGSIAEQRVAFVGFMGGDGLKLAVVVVVVVVPGLSQSEGAMLPLAVPLAGLVDDEPPEVSIHCAVWPDTPSDFLSRR
jgi:hypothetical protein